MTSTLLDEAPARALAVYAHPDDPEVSCGGTLAHWAQAGADVRLVVVNAGDKGSPDAATDPAELTERRAREVDAAAGVHVKMTSLAKPPPGCSGCQGSSGWDCRTAR